MPKMIQDQFSGLPVSAQRKYQLRRQARGLCRICGAAAEPGKQLCLRHRNEQAKRCEHYRTHPPTPRPQTARDFL